MTNFKILALGTAAIVALGASVSYANTQHSGAKAAFTSHHLVSEKNYEAYAKNENAEKKLELREYLNYQQREPCQNYRRPPAGYVDDGCGLHDKNPARMAKVVQPAAMATMTTTSQKREVLADYEVNFAFNSANIEPAAGDTLDKIARDIKKHKPGEVTVAGYADTAGTDTYNLVLSQKRAQAVSDGLNARGVTNRIMDEEAYGETRLEVQTPDGTPNEENRRVEIQFLK